MVSPATYNQSPNGTQFPTTSSNSSSGSASSAANPYAMQPSDFMQLMVTQLENQDPTSPTSSEDLLTQMSQIGQLESTTQLQTTMQSVSLQTQVGSAASLIGQNVSGIDSANNSSSGVVSSVSVAGGNVTLNLNTGDSMPLTGLASINGAKTTSTTPTTGG